MSGLQGDLFDGIGELTPTPEAEATPEVKAGVGVAAEGRIEVTEGDQVVDESAVQEVDSSPADGSLVSSELSRWAEAGWLRRLDSAFSRFIADLDPDASPVLMLAAAMVAHMEGRGHACLEIGHFVESTESVVGWKPEGNDALAALMARLPRDAEQWRRCLSRSAVVSMPECMADVGLVAQADAAHEVRRRDGLNRPLVLDGDRLYLLRYFNYESRVARQVADRVFGHGAHAVDAATAASASMSAGDDTAAAVKADVRDVAGIRRALDRLFDAAEREIDWQRVACAVAMRARLSIITGGPGTGKTYTVARLLALLFILAPDSKRLRVALAAPTGKAAARLKQSIDSALAKLEARVDVDLSIRDLAQHIGPARTLHSLLGVRGDSRHFQHGASNLLDIDVLIVDEASMVHLEMMDALLAALPMHARVIFLGDKDQLASVEAGAVLGDLCGHADEGGYDEATQAFVRAATGQVIPEPYRIRPGPLPSSLAQQTVMLRVSMRFGGAIGRLADAVNAGDAPAAKAAFAATGATSIQTSSALKWLDRATAADVAVIAVAGYRSYLEMIRRGPGRGDYDTWVRDVLTAFDGFRILCAVRSGDWGVEGLNATVARALTDEGLLTGSGEWYQGRPVLVTRNDYAAGVFNGDVGIALRPAHGQGSLRVWFPDGAVLRSVMASRLADVETAFAMTVHKSQGSEFGHTVLALPEDAMRVTSRELVYTGITRARSAFTLITPESIAFDHALAQRIKRASGLPERLAAEEARRHRP